jgi:uncharacterized OB-fold protein
VKPVTLIEPLESYRIGSLIPDHESAEFWQAVERGAFVLQQCGTCGRRQYPPLPRCRFCHSAELSWQDAEPVGSLYSWIVVRHPLVERHRDRVPFAVGLVEIEPGVRVVALLDIPGDELEAEQTIALRAVPTAGGGLIVGAASEPVEHPVPAAEEVVGV